MGFDMVSLLGKLTGAWLTQACVICGQLFANDVQFWARRQRPFCAYSGQKMDRSGAFFVKPAPSRMAQGCVIAGDAPPPFLLLLISKLNFALSNDLQEGKKSTPVRA